MSSTKVEDERELNSIFEDALQIRYAQDAALKRRFESLPKCIQKTLFEEEHVYPRNLRTIENFELYMSKGENLLGENNKSTIIEALKNFERALGCVYFITLKENVPNWRDKGVRDEWIEENRLNDVLACEALTKIAQCLFLNKEYPECLSVSDFAVRLNPSNAQSLIWRAQSRIKLKQATTEAEDLALNDLIKANELEPENQTCKQLLMELKQVKQARIELEKKMFGGLFNPNRPSSVGGNHHANDSKKLNNLKTMESKQIKKELDEIELAAARDAGLDLNDPQIRRLLLSLSTEEGRELFKLERQHSNRMERNKTMSLKICVIAFVCIVCLSAVQQLVWITRQSSSSNSVHHHQGSTPKMTTTNKAYHPDNHLIQDDEEHDDDDLLADDPYYGIGDEL